MKTKHDLTGTIERGEATPIVELPAPAQAQHSPLPDRSTKAQWEKLANEAIEDAGYWKREVRAAQVERDETKRHAQRLADALKNAIAIIEDNLEGYSFAVQEMTDDLARWEKSNE